MGDGSDFVQGLKDPGLVVGGHYTHQARTALHGFAQRIETDQSLRVHGKDFSLQGFSGHPNRGMFHR